MLGLGVMLGLSAGARTDQPAADDKAASASPQDGVEIMARGPIHEAFAEPAIRAPRASPIIAKEPPKSIDELPPDQKPEGDNVQWIPGYWAWDDDTSDFLWVSGTYRTVPPGRHWVPGYWNQADGGSQWVAGLWADQANADLELLPAPPDPIEEAVSPAPDSDSIYEPGCWMYRDNRYQWRNGFWLGNRADWIWSPASYTWTPGGYAFNDGYWDHSFQNRGLLFAPVNIDRRFWGRSDWSYQPNYVVNGDFLLSSLFVRPSYSHYYFGDYYGSGYDGLGFVPWTDFRYGRAIGDPLFGYYRWQNRDNPGWGRDMRQQYATRRDDAAARPPRTLALQNTYVQNINNTTNVNNVTNIKNMTALTSLSRMDNSFVKLQPVTKAQRVEVQKTASQFREFSAQRGKSEAQAGKNIQPSAQPGELSKPVRVALPATRPAPVKIANGSNAKAPPPRPAMPEPNPKAAVATSPATHHEALPRPGAQQVKPAAAPAAAAKPPVAQARPAAPAAPPHPAPAQAAPAHPAPAPAAPAHPAPAQAAPAHPAPAQAAPAHPAPEHKEGKKDK
jgi:hypothetical protein